MNTEVVQKRFTMVLTTVKLPLIELWRETKNRSITNWHDLFIARIISCCSVIVLVVLPIIQHEELMASEWGYKKQNFSNRGKFQWHFDQGKGFSLS